MVEWENENRNNWIKYIDWQPLVFNIMQRNEMKCMNVNEFKLIVLIKRSFIHSLVIKNWSNEIRLRYYSIYRWLSRICRCFSVNYYDYRFTNWCCHFLSSTPFAYDFRNLISVEFHVGSNPWYIHVFN